MSGILSVRSYPPPTWNVREIWRYAGCKAPDEVLTETLDECLAECTPLLTYKVCWREFPIIRNNDLLDIGFIKTDCGLLKKVFDGCDRYILFAATVGVAFDRLITRYSRLSPAKAVLLQAIGAERIESLCDAFEEDIAAGRMLRPRVSPGYGDLPLSMQKDIFRALDCPRSIGLTLNDSFLMSPSKSVTAFIGVKA